MAPHHLSSHPSAFPFTSQAGSDKQKPSGEIQTEFHEISCICRTVGFQQVLFLSQLFSVSLSPSSSCFSLSIFLSLFSVFALRPLLWHTCKRTKPYTQCLDFLLKFNLFQFICTFLFFYIHACYKQL